MKNQQHSENSEPQGSNVPRWLLILFICIAALLACGIILQRPISIKYHRYMMMRAHSKIIEIGPNGHEQSDYIHSFKYHQAILVSRGYFEKIKIPMSFIKNYNHSRWKLLYKALGKTADMNNLNGCFEMRSADSNTPATIVIWARPGRRDIYQKVISEFDRPDANATDTNSVKGVKSVKE